MAKRISATDAKNNFGGLLDDVAALGRVDIVKHGRLVAIVLSPRLLESGPSAEAGSVETAGGRDNHMIPAESARAARMLGNPSGFDDE
jgi:prevent-host-death family protein